MSSGFREAANARTEASPDIWAAVLFLLALRVVSEFGDVGLADSVIAVAAGGVVMPGMHI